MTQIISLPDGTEVEFPDGMTDEAMSAAIQRMLAEEVSPPPAAPPAISPPTTPGLSPEQMQAAANYQVGPAPTAAGLLAADIPGLNMGQFQRDYERERTGIDVPEVTQDMVDQSLTKMDPLNSLASGFGKTFVGGMAKMPETVSGLADAGFNALTGLAPQRPEPGLLTQTVDAITSPLDYEPQTWPGRYMESAGEMGFPATGILGLTMGATSEGAEDLSEKVTGTDRFRPVAGLIGAVFGPGLADKALRAVSPNKIPEALKVANKFLKDKGIVQTAGQQIGDKQLMRLESGSKRLSAMAEKQADDFTAYALTLVDEFGGQATPAVMKAMKTRIGSVFDDVANQTGDMVITNAQMAKLRSLAARYKKNLGTDSPLPKNLLKELEALAGPSGARLPAKTYLEYWTDLGDHVGSGSPRAMQKFAHAAREILDDALQSSATPDNAARLALARKQWRDMLVIRKTLRSPDGAWQRLNPARLRGAIMAQDEAGAIEGTRQIGQLADAGIGIPKLPAVSPTTAIQGVTKAIRPTLIGGAGGGGLGLYLGGPAGAIAGSALGAGGAAGLEVLGAANRAFQRSKLGQRYLVNQLMPNPPQIGGSGILKALLAGNQVDPGGENLMGMLRGGYQQ